MWPFNPRSAAGDVVAERQEPSFKNTSIENPSTPLSNPASWLTEWSGGGPTHAGPQVSERSSVRSTTVFRCVSLIAGLIASLPLGVYQRTKQGRETADKHRTFPLLHDAPNDLMGSFTWRELMAVDLLLGGNHYSLIERDNANRIVGFMPFPRNIVDPFREAGTTRYRVSLEIGQVTLDQDDVLHVPGLSFDGLKGLSPIGVVGRQSIGIDLALSEFVGRMHANGVRPTGMVEVPGNISPQGMIDRQRAFDELYSGANNAGRVVFTDAGSKFTALQINPIDAQTLENRRYQAADICRLFGVPPHLAMETDKSTSWGTGIEQQSLGFLRYTLEPWLKRIEDELMRKLFLGSEFYAEFDRDALLAMDSTARAAAFGSGIQNGYMQPAEVRRKLNMPFVAGSDRLFVNSTLQPMDMAGQRTAAPAPSATPSQGA